MPTKLYQGNADNQTALDQKIDKSNVLPILRNVDSAQRGQIADEKAIADALAKMIADIEAKFVPFVDPVAQWKPNTFYNKHTDSVGIAPAGVTETQGSEYIIHPVADALTSAAVMDTAHWNLYTVIGQRVTSDALYGDPLATIAALTALPARDNEHRKIGNETFRFEAGAATGDRADDAATGFWQRVDYDVDGLDILLSAIGTVKTGLEIIPNADLTFNLTPGEMILQVSSKQWISTSLAAQTPAVFDVMAEDGTVLQTAVSNIAIGQYDTGTGQTSINGNDASFIEMFINSAGHVIQLIGQALYSSINVARDRYLFEAKVLPLALDGYIKIGGFVIRADENSLTDSNVSQVYSSKFGEIKLGSGHSQSIEIFKGSIADTAALQALLAPDDGHTYQDITTLPAVVYWSFNSAATSGLSANDGTTGFWNKTGNQALQDSWNDPADPDHDTSGSTSMRQMIALLSGSRTWHDATTGVLDFDAIQNKAASVHGFDATATLNAGPPAGAVGGLTGFTVFSGDANNGAAFAFISSGQQISVGLWYRLISGNTWGQWTRNDADAWQDTTDPYQASSGARIRIADTHNINLTNLGTENGAAIRVVPKTDWANVPTISATDPDWTISGQPTQGTQEVVYLADSVNKVFQAKQVNVGLTGLNEWPDLGWLFPTHSGTNVDTGVLTVTDSHAITAIEYDLQDDATGVITHKVWDANAFTYSTNGFYGDNVTNDTYTISQDGFFNVFVKKSPTEFHILTNKNGRFQRIRSVKINGQPISVVTGPEHVQQAVTNAGLNQLTQTGNFTGNGAQQVITFATPFETVPVVYATTLNTNLRFVQIVSVTATEFTCRVLDASQNFSGSNAMYQAVG
jgi:hypothetical protein